MKKLIFIFWMFLLGIQHTAAQNNDYYWPMGYTPFFADSTYGRTVIDFKEDPPVISREDRSLHIDATMSSFCDSTGNLMFYTNGIQIMGSDHNRIGGGDSLNTGYYASFDYNGGYKVVQSAFFLPKPGNQDTLYLFHESTDTNHLFSVAKEVLHQTKIDVTANNGLGKVIIKNDSLLTSGNRSFGTITAVKHGNGRDWWVFNSINKINKYNRLLFAQNGVEEIMEVTHGNPVPNIPTIGFIAFSPDGSKFARYEVTHGFSVFDFDRCEGTFSNPVFVPMPNTTLGGGVAFSPNSRFLCITSRNHIYQFDLWSANIAASKTTVAVYDGYQSPFASTFFLMQLGPDGRIYVNCTNGENVLHAIQYPDKKGLACEVRQHSVQLPTYNAFTMPHFPNYRLGPLDSSPCDTLGLDNLPIAKYRYEQDTTDYLQVEFTDLSYYEPATWHWDFGHGVATASEANLVHVFPGPGSYEVCLTVANQYRQHTFCRTLSLGTVSSAEEARAVGVTLFPNPCREAVNVIISEYLPRSARVVLFDAVGRQVLSQAVTAGWNTVRLEGLAAGVYFYQVREGEVLLDAGKVVRVE